MLGKCYRYSHEITIHRSAPESTSSTTIVTSFFSSFEAAAAKTTAVFRRFLASLPARDNRGLGVTANNPAEANFNCTYLLTLRSVTLSSFGSLLVIFRSLVLECIIIIFALFANLAAEKGSEIVYRYVNDYI